MISLIGHSLLATYALLLHKSILLHAALLVDTYMQNCLENGWDIWPIVFVLDLLQQSKFCTTPLTNHFPIQWGQCRNPWPVPYLPSGSKVPSSWCPVGTLKTPWFRIQIKDQTCTEAQKWMVGSPPRRENKTPRRKIRVLSSLHACNRYIGAVGMPFLYAHQLSCSYVWT